MEEGDESEHVSDHFICSVCLDLLYKPVVLVCGHVTCFWCCHHSMDMRGQSHCPLCRHPYRHFPAMCQMLDIFLKKMYPISYSRRKRESRADEEPSSLGFLPDSDCLVTNEESNHLSIADKPSVIISEDKLSINTSFIEKNKLNDASSAENRKLVTVADVLCAACKQLLFRPVVLNCGHVYCEVCITIQEDKIIKCQVCQCLHPSGFPKVFKELDYVIQEQFSSEYALRKNSTDLCQEHIQNGNPSTGNDEGSKFSYPTEDNFLQWWTVNGSKFHPGAGCDMCGMFPIIGDRYQCKDCKEKSGYDLCGNCYNNTGSNVGGRFNQKHTSEHRFDQVKPVINRDVIYRLLSGQLAVVSAASRNRSDHPVNESSEFASSSLEDANGGGG